jgi:hypothetical protein
MISRRRDARNAPDSNHPTIRLTQRVERTASLGAAIVRELGVVLLFLGVAALSTWPLAADIAGTTLLGQDTISHLWTVNWLARHAFDPGQFFGGNVLHPAAHAVLRTDLSLGTVLLVLPFRPFFGDAVPLYNMGLLLALAFGGWATCALCRELTGSVYGGVLAGTFAAFSSHQLSHIYHMNLLHIGWLALFLLGLHRLVRAPGAASAALAGLTFAVTAQSSGYYGMAAVVLSLLFAGVHWRAFRTKALVEWSAAAVLLAFLLILPYARAFLQLRSQDRLTRPVEASERFAFQPARDVSSRSYAYAPLLGSGGQRLFPGALVLLLAGVGLARQRRASAFYAGATLVLLLFSLGPTLQIGTLSVPLPYRWLRSVPPFDAMRHPYTFAAVATFTLAVVAAFGWTSLGLARRAWAGPLAVLLAVGETLGPPADIRRVPAGLPAVYRALEDLPPGPILELPMDDPLPMLWAARHGRPVLNGIVSFVPPRTALLQLVIRNQWLKRVPDDVDRSEPAALLREDFGARYLILPLQRHPHLRPLAAAFDRSRGFVLAAETGNGDRLYSLRDD